MNPQKCVFSVSSIEFLGHLVDCHGIHPLPDKVQCILDFPQPTSHCQLRMFLGLSGFLGLDNSVDDALSQIEANALTQEHHLSLISLSWLKLNKLIPSLPTLLANPQASISQITPCQLYASDLALFCETSTGLPRSFVLESLRRLVFDALHFLILDTSSPIILSGQESTKM